MHEFAVLGGSGAAHVSAQVPVFGTGDEQGTAGSVDGKWQISASIVACHGKW